jgi:hypothetical protein
LSDCFEDRYSGRRPQLVAGADFLSCTAILHSSNSQRRMSAMGQSHLPISQSGASWRKACTKTPRIVAPGLVLAAMSMAVPANATTPVPAGSRLIVVAQAMIPRTGMMDAQNPMPMKERYLKRFPQPAQVGDLIDMPVLDLNSKTLDYVQKVVQTSSGGIQFIVG